MECCLEAYDRLIFRQHVRRLDFSSGDQNQHVCHGCLAARLPIHHLGEGVDDPRSAHGVDARPGEAERNRPPIRQGQANDPEAFIGRLHQAP